MRILERLSSTDEKLVDLWTKAEKFIRDDIIHYMQGQMDNPEWWVDMAEGHDDPEVLKCVRDTLKECFVMFDGKPEGITTAKNAASYLSWNIIDELRLNEPRPDQR